MRKAWLSKADPKELVAAYEAAAEAHGKATESGDYKTANKQADIVAKVYAELRNRGQRESLLPLLVCEDRGVQCWAASHALDFAPERGEPVLAELAPLQNSFVAMSAQITLEQWRKGELTFP